MFFIESKQEDNNLNLQGSLPVLGLLDLGNASSRLGAHAAPTPVLPDLVEPLIVVGLDGLNQLGEGAAVARLNLSDGQARGGLPPADSAEARLVLDDAVRDSHLPAESGQEHDQLDRVDIVSDDHELSLLLLHESGDGVDTVSHHGSPLGGSVLLALSPGGGSLPQPLLLGLLGLGPVFVQELEQLGGCLPVQVAVELVHCGGNLQSGLQNHLLALETDVLGPPHEPGQISGGLDVLADTKVPGSLLEERIDDSLHLLPLDGQRGGRDLLSLPLLAFLIDHLAIGYLFNLL